MSAKLYKIRVLHVGPHSSNESIEGYVVADDERQVFDHIDAELANGGWSEDGKTFTELEGEGDDEVEVEKPYSEWVLRERGDLSDEAGHGPDAYLITAFEAGTQIDYEIVIPLTARHVRRPSDPKCERFSTYVLCPDRLGLFVVKEGALVTYIRLGMMQAEWAAKWYPVKRRTAVASAS